MHHGGVADGNHLVDVARAQAHRVGGLCDQLIDRLDDGFVHLFGAIFVHHGIRDAAHQVFAKGDLRVHRRLSRQHHARAQVAQVGGHCRAADIDGDSVNALDIASLDVEHLSVVPHDHRHAPVALAQRQLQPAQGQHVDGQVGEAPLALERVLQPAPVTAVLAQVCLIYLYEYLADGRIDVDDTVGSRLANHLLLGPAFFGDKDEQVAGDLRRAREPAIVGTHRVQQQPFCLGCRSQMVRARLHGVLGKLALFDTHLAFAAGKPPAANAFDP